MNSEKLNIWLQMTGMTAIVLSLIFVGLQLKQAQEIAIGSQYALRASEARESWQRIFESPEILAYAGSRHREHLIDARQYDEEWADETVGLWYSYVRSYLAAWDNNHY